MTQAQIQMYTVCLLVALIGAAIHFFVKMNNIMKGSKIANVEFFPKRFYNDEKISMIISLLTIFLALFLLGELLDAFPRSVGYKNLAFAFLGYGSDYLASYFFSFAQKRLDQAVDFKTTELDRANGTLDKPTPAVLSTDKPA